MGCVIFSLIMQIAGKCTFAALRHHRQHLKRLSGCWAAVILLLIAIIYLSKLADEFSRGWILLWAVNGWLGLMGTRLLAWRVMRSLQARGHLITQIAVVGHGSAAENCTESLQRDDDDDIRVIGVFEAASARNDTSGSYGYRDLGDLAQLAANAVVDEIVVAVACNELTEYSLIQLAARRAVRLRGRHQTVPGFYGGRKGRSPAVSSRTNLGTPARRPALGRQTRHGYLSKRYGVDDNAADDGADSRARQARQPRARIVQTAAVRI